jgi:multiple sugar transport system permease protein
MPGARMTDSGHPAQWGQSKETLSMSILTRLRHTAGIEKRSRTQTISSLRRKEALAAYLFIAPTFIGFFIFIVGPMIFSLGLSLFQWNILSPAEFVGLGNYIQILGDARVLTAFRNTAVFVLIVVTLDVVIALALAVALQSRMPDALRYFFRTAFFLPVVTSVAAISVVLAYMLNTRLGVVNYYITQLGFERIPWLSSSDWALISIALATVWKTFGFNLLLFTAGIQNIPEEMYEAADIDGANTWQKFRKITIPLLSPTIFFVVVISLISHFQMFDQANIMTGGGPGNATRSIVMVIWEDSFGSLRLGYGSAIATVLFLVILALTLIQFRFTQRWVYYEGGGESQ